ncbi:MAG: hypothetical protein K2M63_00855 [Muribaculaceae bacterium]|nr:hypothetical protein [Muribaculaceae bacterium]
MKSLSLLLMAISFLGATALCSCSGRTSKDMVPNGDTVEVVIASQTDSIVNIDTDSINNEN